MIELTLQELVESVETLQLILDQPMRARLSYKIACIAEEVEKENVKYNNERNKLIAKYAIRDSNNNLIEKDGQYTIAPENIQLFNNELIELLNTNINCLSAQLDLVDIEELQLTPRQMLKIKKYIKKEEA